jgi:hypothetical protein
MEEVRFRRSRRLSALTLVVGCVVLVALLAIEFLRTPLLIGVCVAAVLVGAITLFDRRVQLSLSQAGVRYSRWGPAVVAWQEFAGFRRATWRGQPFLQLVPRRPSELVASFTPLGKVNHYCYRLLRMPPFGIAVMPLEVHESVLEELTAKFLPEQPVA